MFDRAKSHLDITMEEAADSPGKTLFYLSSIATKGMFKCFESCWDQYVVLTTPWFSVEISIKVGKQRFTFKKTNI